MTRSETEQRSAETVPVFAITSLGGVRRAAHPDCKAPLPSKGGEEILSRVGSAWRQQDGSYLIQLVAFPVNGQLLLRPSLEEEGQPSTYQEEQT
jgi:hypothetical protein